MFSGAIAALGSLSLPAAPSPAQLWPDASLGAEGSVVTPDATVRGVPASLIEGGASRGSNLFHSFSEFNVGTGQAAYFANPVGIENILTRVTGGRFSTIDGLLGVDGAANLFLLNPNGVLFGPSARLDIGGSFLTSTGSSVAFADGSQFSAAPTGNELLSVSVPLGVQFNNPQGDITSRGILEAGQDLTLVGNTLFLEGQLLAGGSLTLQGANTVQIRDSAEGAFIAGAGDRLLVQGNETVDIFALNHPNSGLFANGDLILRSARAVQGDAHYFAGGNFLIEDLSRNLNGLESPNDPVIRTFGNVSFAGYIGASLHIIAGGSVTVRDFIFIDGADPDFGLQETVTLSNGETLAINGQLTPTLDIRAGVSPEAIAPPGLFPNPLPGGAFFLGIDLNEAGVNRADITIGQINDAGDFTSGRVSVGGGLVFLTNQYRPNQTTILGGDIQVGSISNGGGTVIIDSRNDIASTGLYNPSSFNEFNGGFIDTSSPFVGNGGNVFLRAANAIEFLRPVLVTGGCCGAINLEQSLGPDAFINTTSRRQAGSVRLEAGQGITIDGPIAIDTSLLPPVFNDLGPVGTGGNIQVSAPGVTVRNGAQLRANTAGLGDAGDITVLADAVVFDGTRTVNLLASGPNNAPDFLSLNDLDNLVASGAFSQVQPNAQGNAGSVTVNSRLLTVANGAQLSSVTNGRGHAGNVTITATESATFAGVGRNAVNVGFSNGSAGYEIGSNFELKPPSGAFSSVRRDAVVDAAVRDIRGSVTINAQNLQVLDGARLTSSTSGIGNAGDVTINADTVVLRGGGENQTTPGAPDDFSGGISVLIQTDPSLGVAVDGGNININTRLLTVSDGIVLASLTRGRGDAGDVTIAAREAVSFDGSFVLSEVQPQGIGAGGDINLTAPTISLRNGSQFRASTLGQGAVGDLPGPAVASDSLTGGRAGDLNVRAGVLFLRGGVELSVNSASPVGGGNVNIDVDGSLIMSGNSFINASSTNPNAGDGGNITIRLRDGFLIGPPGQSNDIIANAVGGNGGNITISALRLLGVSLQNDSNVARLRSNGTNDISASSEVGLPGAIALNTLDLDPSQGLVELPVDLSDRANQVTPGCGLGNGDTGSEFVATGRGGLPPGPGDPIAATGVAVPWVVADEGAPAAQVPPSTPVPPLVEAQGIAVDAAGNHYFVAEASTVAGANSSTLGSQTCAVSARRAAPALTGVDQPGPLL